MEWCKCIVICLIVCMLVWISYGDICRKKIGKLPTVILLLLAILYRWTSWIMDGRLIWASLGFDVLLSLVGGVLLAVMVELVNLLFFQLKGMGGGDIRLLFVMGFLLGFEGGLQALMVGLVMALGYSLAKMGYKASGTIPMGPFLSIGMIVVVAMDNFLL